MLHERSFNRNFHVLNIRREYRVNPYSQQWTNIPLVCPFAERVIVPIRFLTVTLFLKNCKNFNHAAIAQVPFVSCSYERTSVVSTTNLHKNIAEKLFLSQGTPSFER